ncbi:hypothetical protein VYU27_004695 [Nannochloropsis oceanica]
MSKINFQVVYASGQDPDYPADELNVHSPGTKGWQSPRFCDYPQELGLALLTSSSSSSSTSPPPFDPCLSGPPPHLTRVQLLSHQCKIATKIELFIGDGSTYESAAFARLGYLSLNSNQRSDFQARELKSVFLSCSGRYLKLIIHQCYVNKYNLFNQVGLIAINLLGGEEGEVGQPPSRPEGVSEEGEEGVHDLVYEMSPFDPQTTRRLRMLTLAKEAAVKEENYDEAKRLKAAESALRGMGGRISALEEEKRKAVRAEEYDKAKALKFEIEILRREMEGKLRPYLRHGHLGQGGREGGREGGLSPSFYPPLTAGGFQRQPQHQLHLPIEPVRVGGGGGTATTTATSSRGASGGVIPAREYDEIPVGAAGRTSLPPSLPRPPSPSRGEGGAHVFQHPLHHDSEAIVPGGNGGGGGGKGRGGGGGGGGEEEEKEEAEDRGMPPPPPLAYPPSPIRSSRALPVFDEDAPLPVDRRVPGRGGGLEGGHEEEGEEGGERGGKEEGRGEREWAWQGEGPHPLDGIPTYDWRDLPFPEPLGGREGGREGEVAELVYVFGEYWTRCFLSKSWALRDAAVLKAKLLVEGGVEGGQGGREGGFDIKEGLSAVADVLTIAVEDKMTQVLMSVLALLPAFLAAAQATKLKRSVVGPLIEPVIASLVNRLGDGQQRVRDAALSGLLSLASSPCVGVGGVGPYALRKLEGKQANAAKTVVCRLVLLKKLVELGGGGRKGGPVGLEGVMGFLRGAKVFSHSSHEVREGGREVVVALFRVVGGRVYGYIEPLLRRKQKDEYEEAFRKVLAEGTLPVGIGREGGWGREGGGMKEGEEGVCVGDLKAAAHGKLSSTTAAVRPSRGVVHSPPQKHKLVLQRQQQQRKKQAASPISAPPAAAAAAPRRQSPPPSPQPHQEGDTTITEGDEEGRESEEEEEEEEEEVEEEVVVVVEEEEEEEEEEEMTCQFCGLYEPGLTEDALDHHYFTDCPLLMRCVECGQVIEIFGLSEHLLTECEEAKGEYVPCAMSGLAVRRDQLDAWRMGPGAYFEEVGQGGREGGREEALCPLCFYEIDPATEEGVKAHYLMQCPQNPRREGAGRI